MRGAVSVALAYYYFDIGSPTGSSGDRHRSTLIAATLVVVLITVLVLGACTQPLMQVRGRRAVGPRSARALRTLPGGARLLHAPARRKPEPPVLMVSSLVVDSFSRHPSSPHSSWWRTRS